MHKFLQSLYDDHETLLKLLAAFERELGVFEQAGDADYDVLETGIEYCAEYVEAVHHPKEEQMLDQLRKRNPAAAESVAELSRQHRDLEHLTHALSMAFGSVHDGAFARREELLEPGREWLKAYREHLHWEEENMFNTAAAELTDADWNEAHTHWEHAVNPLHEHAKDERFKQLGAIIREMANS